MSNGIDWLLLRDCEAILDAIEAGRDITRDDVKALRDLLNQSRALVA